MHKRQQEILEKKRQQQEREANNATVRPADRNRWLPASTSGDEKSKRQVIPSFNLTPDTKPSAPPRSNAASLWTVATSAPAPPKMTTRSVDPKAPLAAVAKAAEATTSKITLDQVRVDPSPQPPRLSHKSVSSTPDNRTIWHPKPEPKPEPMTRSARIEKSKSTSVVARTRTVSDPVPPSPRAATKALPGSSTPPRQEKEKVEKKPAIEKKSTVQNKEEGKGKKKVTVEDVPETDDAVGGGLPPDSTALMLSNIEPESPSLVDREIKENETEKARHVRWTPPSETATSTTTRPRANSTAKQAQGGRPIGDRVY
ncbi:hypothetical protein CPB85DRAFT_162094 [Mucidula mucida]|nr:hypothetical protein CPB85DRAFT_162094 [Mucidula mucida]